MTVVDLLEPRATAAPVPSGRGRWRLTLHQRNYAGFSNPMLPSVTGIGELISARSRRLEQAWNSPATLSFTLDGRSPNAAALRELAHEVIAWRWNDDTGADVAMFHGPICQTEDQLTEQAHTVNVVCHDYLAMLGRRYLTSPTPLVFTQVDQDQIAGSLIGRAHQSATTGSGTPLTPGSLLPITADRFNPDGTGRTSNSGQLRDRTYFGSQEIGQAVDDLARVINGFDYDCSAAPVKTGGISAIRQFYPQQGVARTDFALVYGSTVSTVTRSVNSADYANYVRVLGNNGNSDPAAAQLYAETWNSDATAGTLGAIGLWQLSDNASDVTVQATLNDKAAGDLALYGVLVPHYSLGLRPGWYRPGYPNMGDTVALVIRSGRLNVNTTIRVLGITYVVGDDGQEDVELVVGRPQITLVDLLDDARQSIDALARR